MERLGFDLVTAIILLIALYFVVKSAVSSAIDDSKNEIAKAVKKGIEKYEREKAGRNMRPAFCIGFYPFFSSETSARSFL